MTTSDNMITWKRYLSPHYLVSKFRVKGLMWYLRRACGIFYIKPFRRFINLLSWLFPILRMFLRPISHSEKRILAIWDFRVVPFTVGELLICQEVSLFLRELHRVDKIDLVLLCDEKQPARSDGGMDSQNFHYCFSKLFPVAFVNPYLGSLLILDSREHLASYIAENHERYYVFPPYSDPEERSLTESEQLFNYVQTLYANHGYIPHLSCQHATIMWAAHFLSDRIRPRLPVTIHLRNTSTTTYRNARLECWFDLFDFCQTRYDVTFVLIGDKSEIDPRMRGFPNVLVAKDYGTTVEEDLALIQTAMFFMGNASGPSTMAIFSDLPYVICNFQTVHEKLTPGQPLPWATRLQKLVWEPETTEQLIEDFSWLYREIEKAQWAAKFDRLANEARINLKRREHFRGIVIEGLGGCNV